MAKNPMDLNRRKKNNELLIEAILNRIFLNRRQYGHESDSLSEDCEKCKAVHRRTILHAVEKWLPITLILPAFPAKSVNPEKTKSYLPDLGERIALRMLNSLCQDIQELYQPGAQLVICSDGRVFNDLVKVPDNHVALYTQKLQKILLEENLYYISLMNLEDLFDQDSYHNMRENLILNFAEELEYLKFKIKNNQNDKILFNGIHRFIYEDQKNLWPNHSNNKIRNMTKEITYQVIQRSNAWSAAIEKSFPDAIRLSIHPQRCQSEKIGIMLLKSNNPWMTPWHSVPVVCKDQYYLMKRRDAEKLNALVVTNRLGEFSHYQVEKI